MRYREAEAHEEHEPLLSNAFLQKAIAVVAMLATLMAGISFAGRWYGKELALAGHTDSSTLRHIQIGDDTMLVAENMIRFREQRVDGPADRLNIYLAWPEMQGYSEALRDRFDQLSLANGLVFLEVSEATMSRDMSGRLEPIYARLFADAGEPAAFGLTMHRLRNESGYGNEVILTAPRNGRPDYVVRCTIPVPPAEPTAADCQRDIHVGNGLSALYRFSSTLLKDWDHIDAAIETFVSNRLADAKDR